MRNSKSIKTIIAIVIISMVFILSILATGCFPMAGDGSTTVATNADGTPVKQTWLAKYGTWIWLVVLVVAFYFLLIRPQRQRSKTQQDLLGNLQRGDEIVTVGGIFGKIKDVGGDSIIITISSGVDIKISKSAIARKIVADVTASSGSLKK
jgi:preprotein translocase subunit YajC